MSAALHALRNATGDRIRWASQSRQCAPVRGDARLLPGRAEGGGRLLATDGIQQDVDTVGCCLGEMCRDGPLPPEYSRVASQCGGGLVGRMGAYW